MRELHSIPEAVQWLRERVSGRLLADSRLVQAGDGFLAWPGGATDARAFVASALTQGAAACLVEREGLDSFDLKGPRTAAVVNLKRSSGPIAAAYFDQPSNDLDVIAVTGTNGKTSTTWWISHALDRSASSPGVCGLVGTLGIGRAGQLISSGLTTPDPVSLQQSFREFVAEGCRFCAIEASSIGLEEGRLAGTAIRTAVFTNFTQDHLDYHGTMESYWKAKRALFEWPGLQAAIVNLDDPKGRELVALAADRHIAVRTYAVNSRDAQLVATDIQVRPTGLAFDVHEGGVSASVCSSAFGTFNVSNLLAVLAVMRSQGFSLSEAAKACSELPPVPGRMEVVATGVFPTVLVDYAHTPDALEKSLATARSLAEIQGGRLWCIFGCGGDRDPTKRPIMGALAEAGADEVVVTNDNPRSEAPEAIADAILSGFGTPGRARTKLDRGRAIAWTVEKASEQDVILIAGKGHESYQESRGVRAPFSDREEALKALRSRSALLRERSAHG